MLLMSVVSGARERLLRRSRPQYQVVKAYYALPLPRHPLSVGTFLSLSPSTKPLATKFKRGPLGSNPTYFRFSPSKKVMN